MQPHVIAHSNNNQRNINTLMAEVCVFAWKDLWQKYSVFIESCILSATSAAVQRLYVHTRYCS
jgi:hypothetical protein